MTTSNRPLKSEDVYGEKWDRCTTDTLVKTGLYHYYLLNEILIVCSYISIWPCFGYCFFCCTLQT